MSEPTGNIVVDASHRLHAVQPYRATLQSLSGLSAKSFHSDHGEADDEMLKWAAIERLPTYDRVKTAIISKVLEDGKIVPQEVDVTKLTVAERAKLVERALETNDQDNEALLRKLRARLDRVNLQFPTVEVHFKGISAEAKVQVGKRALPSLSNFTLNMISTILRSLKLMPDMRIVFPILHNVSSVLKPGRMTLLLGPPGAGKSTLMKELAGKSDDDLKISGQVQYNGHSFDEFVVDRTAAYVAQNDVHLGEMTVRETLDFSARVQGAGFKAGMGVELLKREKEMGIQPDPTVDAFMKGISVEGRESNLVTDYVLKILGLEVCADTVVGNEMLRGISGGQKKRVTTGEMVVGPQQVLLMDEISTGLDSSTTFLITKCLRNLTHFQNATVIVALLQPAPETYDLFDDIMLLAEGQIVYHGPREEIVEFFRSMGFVCPERKGIADFLQEVTSLKDQEQYWEDKRRPYKFLPVQLFAEEFKRTRHGRSIQEELERGFPKEKSHPEALVKERYGLPQKEMLKAVFSRELLLMKRNSFLYIAQTINMAITALITMSVYFRTTLKIDLTHGTYIVGAVFFGLVTMMFNGFAEMTLLIQRQPVYYKQRDNYLYPAWPWSLSMWVLSIPFSLWSCLVWSVLTYYTIGFSPSPGRFFCYLLLLFTIHQLAIGMFRTIGSIGRSLVVSNTFGAFGIIVLFLLGGFILAKKDIHPYWIWGFWISPLSYIMNGLTANEFLSERWQKPAGSLYPGKTVGEVLLESRSLFRKSYWVWLGIGAGVGYIILFNFLTTLCLQYLNPLGKPQPMVSEEYIEAKKANLTGEGSVHKTTSQNVSKREASARALERYRTVQMQSSNLSQGIRMQGSNLSQGIAMQHSSLSQGMPIQIQSSNLSAAGEKPIRIEPMESAVTDAMLSESGEASKKGMVLAFEPLSLSFHNVNYYVDMPAEMKAQGMADARLQLLRNVSGAFRPRVLTALVGVSGAGKTTLMDVLAGRKTGGYIEGDVRVSGYPKVQETFARISGYCEQNDIHSPQVTVQESLIYSAWLRLSSDIDKEVREAFVEEVMELVELDTLRDALVGLPGVTGLSTEQRKRLTIAVELVANPSIIFMDEPTSGLDARAAAIVMRTVRNTVDTGRTVVCTIHQPSIDIFEAFDELLLMKRGGQVIYMGPLGKNSQIMVDYFQAIPGVVPNKEGYNPATWMLEISAPAIAEKMGVDFAEIFRNSEQFRKNEELIELLKTPPEGHEDLHFPTQYSTDTWTQFVACLWKRQRMYWRYPDYNVVRYFFCTTMALLVGGVFYDLGSRRATQQDVLNIMGALYTASLFMGWNNASSVQPVIAIERTVFYRETAAGMYSGVPYAMAQGVIEIPYVLVQTILYGTITYALIHFEWTAAKFFWYFVYMYLTLLYFTYYGMMAMSISPNDQLSMVISGFFFTLWNLFSGFLIPRPGTPIWWRWYPWCNPVAWTLYGLIASQLGDVETTIAQPGVHPDVTVKQYLKNYFDYEHSMLPYIIIILIAFAILFFTVFAYALKKLNFQNR